MLCCDTGTSKSQRNHAFDSSRQCTASPSLRPLRSLAAKEKHGKKMISFPYLWPIPVLLSYQSLLRFCANRTLQSKEGGRLCLHLNVSKLKLKSKKLTNLLVNQVSKIIMIMKSSLSLSDAHPAFAASSESLSSTKVVYKI